MLYDVSHVCACDSVSMRSVLDRIQMIYEYDTDDIINMIINDYQTEAYCNPIQMLVLNPNYQFRFIFSLLENVTILLS